MEWRTVSVPSSDKRQGQSPHQSPINNVTVEIMIILLPHYQSIKKKKSCFIFHPRESLKVIKTACSGWWSAVAKVWLCVSPWSFCGWGWRDAPRLSSVPAGEESLSLTLCKITKANAACNKLLGLLPSWWEDLLNFERNLGDLRTSDSQDA